MQINSDGEEAYPLMARLCEHLSKTRPMYRKMLKGLMNQGGEEFWRNGESRCREILYFCDGDVEALLDSVSVWARFSTEYQRRQQNFLKNRRYASTSYEAILHDLYEDDRKMKDYYLLALMFSYIFSANYIGYLSFFRKSLLPRIEGAAAVCDVGCGAGVYLAQLLIAEPNSVGIGLDISQASLDMSNKLLGYYNISPNRYKLLKGDLRSALPVADSTQDVAVCCEVIEHLEDPFHTLTELRRLLKPDGLLCLSTAIRMESIDHLYLFSHPREVQGMLAESGFQILSEDYIPLTTEPVTDEQQRQRQIDDPDVALGYIALAC